MRDTPIWGNIDALSRWGVDLVGLGCRGIPLLALRLRKYKGVLLTIRAGYILFNAMVYVPGAVRCAESIFDIRTIYVYPRCLSKTSFIL